MLSLLWLDIVSLSASGIVMTALMLVVLGVRPRHALNQSFALFALMEISWSFSALLLRLSLWFGPMLPARVMQRDPAFWLEMTALSAGLMSVFALLFTAFYLGRRSLWTDLGVLLGLLLTGILTVPLFRHQLTFNPQLDGGGMVFEDISTWGSLAGTLIATYLMWSLVLFWQERHRTKSTGQWLGLSLLFLLIGFLAGGLFDIPFPSASILNTLSGIVMGYAIITRQLFNPLRERTTILQREVAERERAEATLQQRTAQLEALRRVGLELTAQLDLDVLLLSIASQAIELLGGLSGGLYLCQPNGDMLEWIVGVGPFTPPLGSLLRRGEGLSGRVWETGEPLIVDDYQHWEGRATIYQDMPPTAVIAAPIRWGQELLGVLNVQAQTPRTFSPADAEMLSLFAAQAAIAIENAHLHREVVTHADELEQRVQERTAELQAQYARLDAILGSTTDGIVVTDGQGNLVQANPVAQAWLTQTLVPEEAVQLQQEIQALARQTDNETTGGETPTATLELTGIDLELRASPVTKEGTSGSSVVVDIHDVTHLKALDRIKNQFIANISHEFRTPITTIMLYISLIQHRPEKWQEHIDVLAPELDRLTQLVEDILEISRIDAGRLEMNPRPLPLNDLTESAITNHQELAQEQKLTLEHRPTKPGPVALVDPERIMRVMGSLMVNAIQFTPDEGTVTVSTGTGKADGRTWATITVADTGIGIPTDELPYIFDRFFRGEKPNSAALRGTGLGLSIVKEIVALHGGHVTVKSEEGAGSDFTVWLPIIANLTAQSQEL